MLGVRARDIYQHYAAWFDLMWQRSVRIGESLSKHRRKEKRPTYDILEDEDLIEELKQMMQPRNWRAIALFCAAHRFLLRDQRENDFITNVLAQTQAERPLSRKQMKWLRDIYGRLLKVAEDLGD